MDPGEDAGASDSRELTAPADGKVEEGNAEDGEAEEGNADEGNADEGNADEGNVDEGNVGSDESGWLPAAPGLVTALVPTAAPPLAAPDALPAGEELWPVLGIAGACSHDC